MITGDSVAVRRDDVTSVEIEGETVLYDGSNRVLHRLNPTASAIWLRLDGSGTLAEIAADLAEVFGAAPGRVLEDVVKAVRQFGDDGLLAVGAEPSAAEPVEVIQEGEPGPFVDEHPAPTGGEPAGSLTVRVGDHLLGVRLRTIELLDAATAVLAPSLMPNADAPSNVSIVATRARTGRSMLWCYRSTRLLGRHRGVRRAVEAAVALLSSYGRAPENSTRLGAVLAVRDGTAVLLSSVVYNLAGYAFPALRGGGWQLLDGPWVHLDRDSGRVVVPASAVEVDLDALARLPADPLDRDPPPAGTFQVRAWVDIVPGGMASDTTAARVTQAAGDALDIADHGPAALRALERMLAGAAWEALPDYDPRGVVAALDRATAS